MRRFISRVRAARINDKTAIILTIATLALLLPFIGKAVHIDDPLFIWAAKHIRSHPLDPYGFKVNWYGISLPMYRVTENPPLASYYLAMTSLLLGWSEVALHLAMMIPAVAVILGTYRLARQLAPAAPVVAAAATLLTPVFLLSATTLMSDMLMLALWIWAVVLWLEGWNKGRQSLMLLSGIIIAIAIFTKYYAASLIPLLGLYSVLYKRADTQASSSRAWILYLLIPLILLLLYDLYTGQLYGKRLFSDAGAYTAVNNILADRNILSHAITGLCFSGGCLLTLLFCFPDFKRNRGTAIYILATSAVTLLLICLAPDVFKEVTSGYTGIWQYLLAAQFFIMAFAGLAVLSMAAADFLEYRDASSGLLCAWIFGTFIFASMMNWTVNGRSILPMAPAAGIILARRMAVSGKALSSRIIWPAVLAAILSLSVCCADYMLAGTARLAAKTAVTTSGIPAGNIKYQGHWGFQYYMDLAGVEALDFSHLSLKAGDLLIVPENNTNTRKMPTVELIPYCVKDFRSCPWLATMQSDCKAGFYSSIWGPLPYAFITPPPELFYYVIVKKFHSGSASKHPSL